MHEVAQVLIVLGHAAVFIVHWAFKLWLWWCALVFAICVLAVLVGKYWPKRGDKGREGG
jgi:hypothetical protein